MELPKLKKVTEIKRRDKKKILLLSDDLRMHSGVGTMSREIVMGTLDKYDWVQVGGAIKHPDKGKIFDLADSMREETGVKDAYCKVYPVDGYGNPDIVRELIQIEKPDAIMIYTDPRFWIWLFEMEQELRQNIPIFYYNIWDDLPYPRWNEPYYESCDLIMNISKQTHNIVQNVCQNKPRTDWDSTYIPHGINEKYFYPITEADELIEMNKMKSELFQSKEIDFSMLYINRNIRRKMTSDTILAFKEFADKLPKEKRDRTAFILHTQPIDQNGTDLPAVVEELCPDLNIIFSTQKLDNKGMNYLYNIADVTINLASNEGFGLGTCESLMCGTPIIVNVTGGMQDQCGFKWNVAPSNLEEQWEYLTADDYKDIGSLHNWREWEDKVTHGEWVKPVWSRVQTMVGSIPTPYIIDDKVDVVEVSNAIEYWYDIPQKERKKRALIGREEFLGEMGLNHKNMCQTLVDGINTTFKNWKPKEKFNVYKIK